MAVRLPLREVQDTLRACRQASQARTNIGVVLRATTLQIEAGNAITVEHGPLTATM